LFNEEGVTTLGCRNASNAVAGEEGCGRRAAGYCSGREEYSYKMECNVSGVEVGHDDSINIMGALERRALVSHKQERYCAIVLSHNGFSANNIPQQPRLSTSLQFDPSVDGEDNWRHNTVCTGCAILN
jgi:hypothetical protein